MSNNNNISIKKDKNIDPIKEYIKMNNIHAIVEQSGVQIPCGTNKKKKTIDTQVIKQKVLNLLFNTTNNAHNYKHLPGAMPVTLLRKDIMTLITDKYWVLEKSDGVRHLLLIDTDSKGYLIDRAWNIKEIEDPNYINIKKVPVLLDGEVIMNETTKVEQYSMFDIISYNNTYYANQYLPIRHKAMSLFIQDYLKLKNISMPIQLKAFRPVKELHQITDCIQYDEKTNHYIYKDNKGRHNLNDGLVFIPVEDDYFCKDKTMFKWKWLELNTIDCLIKNLFDNNTTLHFYVGGPNNSEIDFMQTRFDHLNSISKNYINQIKELKLSQCIVECNIINSNCQIVGLRMDKNIANYIVTAKSTKQAIDDNILINELIQLFKN